jgi:hypothetical protein
MNWVFWERKIDTRASDITFAKKTDAFFYIFPVVVGIYL